MRENGQEKDINLFMCPYPSIYNTACVLMEEEDNQWTAVQVNVAFCCHYEPEAMTTSLAGVWKPSRTLGPAPVAPAAAGPTLKPPHAPSLSLSLPLYFASQPNTSLQTPLYHLWIKHISSGSCSARLRPSFYTFFPSARLLFSLSSLTCLISSRQCQSNKG